MTHINAFFSDVEEAKVKLQIAKGELEAAEARLMAKKLEDGFVEEVVDVEKPKSKAKKSGKKK